MLQPKGYLQSTNIHWDDQLPLKFAKKTNKAKRTKSATDPMYQFLTSPNFFCSYKSTHSFSYFVLYLYYCKLSIHIYASIHTPSFSCLPLPCVVDQSSTEYNCNFLSEVLPMLMFESVYTIFDSHGRKLDSWQVNQCTCYFFNPCTITK